MTEKVPVRLEDVKREFTGYPFPRFVFNKCESALMLFCAGFYGGHDCVWVADAGLTNVIAVDHDADKLNVMKQIYPKQWSFLCTDIYKLNLISSVDLVVADVQISQIEYAQNWISAWCAVANRYLIVTGKHNELTPIPKGWKELGKLYRSDEILWLILARK